MARDPARAADQWAAATTLKLGLLGLVGPFYLAAPLVAQRPWDTTAAVWLLGLAIALQGFVENGVAVFTGLQRLDQELLARLVEKSVLVTVGFAALGLGAGLLGVILAFVLAAVVSLAFGTWRIHRRLAPLRRWWRPAAARVLARELAPVAHAQFLGVATSRLAPVAVALIAGDRAAGYFGAAFRVYDVLAIVPVSLVAAVYPELARTPPRHPRFRAITTQSVEALLLVAWPVALGLAVGAPWLTSWIYGPGYGPAAPVLAVLGAAVACSMLQHFLGVTLLALDRPGRVRAIAGLAFLTGLLAIPGAVLAARRGGGRRRRPPRGGGGRGGESLALRGAAGWPLGRGAAKGLGAAAAGAVVASLLPAGPERLWAPSRPTRSRSSCCGPCRVGLPAPAARRPRPPGPAVGGGGAVVHVVLDARYIARRQSGVGAYAQRLVAGLATIDRVEPLHVSRGGRRPGPPGQARRISRRGPPASPSRTISGGTSGFSGTCRSGSARSGRTSTTARPSFCRT